MPTDNHITANIITDSMNPSGSRLTTWVLEYPRFCHGELLTHRVFSKSSASSRAIPIKTVIKNITDNPAMPTYWGKNQSGMSSNEELDDITEHPRQTKHRLLGEECIGSSLKTDKEYAKSLWIEARDSAIEYAMKLSELGVHKQITNRILEPWFNIKVILTGTEFKNFFTLRAHPDAQPELQVLAYKMKELYDTSVPNKLNVGEWHVPFGDKLNEEKLEELVYYINGGLITNSKAYKDYKDDLVRKIAIARCARISYLNFNGKDDYLADVNLCDRLFGSIPRHLSPSEHIAQATDSNDYIGNYRGFKQYRKFFLDESGE